jgi:hypothetical protein
VFHLSHGAQKHREKIGMIAAMLRSATNNLLDLGITQERKGRQFGGPSRSRCRRRMNEKLEIMNGRSNNIIIHLYIRGGRGRGETKVGAPG